MKKIFLLLIKYIPIIQMVGILISDTMFYFGIGGKIYTIMDYLLGNSVVTTFLLYVCSYVFKFCNWHRYIITCNLITISTVVYDIIYLLPLSAVQVLALYYAIAIVFSLIAIYSKFHCHESTNKETSNK